jgi:hypothetical protein
MHWSGSICFHFETVAAVYDRRSSARELPIRRDPADVDLDSRTSIRFALSEGHAIMKTSLRLLVALFVIFFTFAKFAAADDNFVSAIVQVSLQINVGSNKSLVIRNFTQNGGVTRGTIQVMSGSFTVPNVLTATIVDPALQEGFLEPVNEIVIAGPATVTVTAGDQACFITYRKVDN